MLQLHEGIDFLVHFEQRWLEEWPFPWVASWATGLVLPLMNEMAARSDSPISPRVDRLLWREFPT